MTMHVQGVWGELVCVWMYLSMHSCPCVHVSTPSCLSALPSPCPPPLTDAMERATRLALSHAQDEAHKQSGSLFFTMPPLPVAGAPAVLYVNRKRSWVLADSPNVRVGGCSA